MSFIKEINPFYVMMAGFAVGIIACLGIVIMHFLTPKRLIEKDFRPPYFSITESAYFVGKVYSINFTVMFMSLTAFPRLGKKRKLTQMYKEVPRWYQITSRIILILVISSFIVTFVLTILAPLIG